MDSYFESVLLEADEPVLSDTMSPHKQRPDDIVESAMARAAKHDEVDGMDEMGNGQKGSAVSMSNDIEHDEFLEIDNPNNDDDAEVISDHENEFRKQQRKKRRKKKKKRRRKKRRNAAQREEFEYEPDFVADLEGIFCIGLISLFDFESLLK